MSRCRPTHGRADLALLQRGLRVLAIAQRGKHDLRRDADDVKTVWRVEWHPARATVCLQGYAAQK